MAQPRSINPHGTLNINYRCFVPGCPNSTEHDEQSCVWTREYFPFPTRNSELYSEWLNVIGRSDQEPQPWHRVCSDHFPEGVGVQEGCVPSIFSWTTTVVDVSELPLVTTQTMAPQKVWLKNVETGMMQQIEVSPEVAEQLQKDLAVYDQPIEGHLSGEGNQTIVLQQMEGQYSAQNDQTLSVQQAEEQYSEDGQQTIIVQQAEESYSGDGQQTIVVQQAEEQYSGDDQQTIIVQQAEEQYSGDGQQTIVVQQAEEQYSGDGQQTIIVQQAEEQYSGDGQQTIVVQQAEEQYSGDDQQTIIVQQAEESYSGDDQQTIVVQQAEEQYSEDGQQTIVVQQAEESYSEDGQHTIVVQYSGADQETIGVQQTQEQYSGDGHQTMVPEQVELPGDGGQMIVLQQRAEQYAGGDNQTIIQMEEQYSEQPECSLVIDTPPQNLPRISGEANTITSQSRHLSEEVCETIILQAEGSGLQENIGESILIQAVGQGISESDNHNETEGSKEIIILQEPQNIDAHDQAGLDGLRVVVHSSGPGTCTQTVPLVSTIESTHSQSRRNTMKINVQPNPIFVDSVSSAQMTQSTPKTTKNADIKVKKHDISNAQKEQSNVKQLTTDKAKVTGPRSHTGGSPSSENITQTKQPSPSLRVCVVCDKVTTQQIQGNSCIISTRIPTLKQAKAQFPNLNNIAGYVCHKCKKMIADVQCKQDKEESDMAAGDSEMIVENSEVQEETHVPPDFLSHLNLVPQSEMKARASARKKQASQKKLAPPTDEPIISKPITRKSLKPQISDMPQNFDPNSYVCVGCKTKMERYKRGYARWTLSIVADLESVKSVFPHLNSDDGYVCYNCRKLLVAKKEENVPTDDVKPLLLKVTPNTCVCCQKAFKTYKKKTRLCRWTLSVVSNWETVKSLFPHLESLAGYCCTECRMKLNKEQNPEQVEIDSKCIVCKYEFEEYSKSNHRYKLASCAPSSIIQSVFPQLSGNEGYVCYKCRALAVRMHRKKTLSDKTAKQALKRKRSESSPDSQISSDTQDNKDKVSELTAETHPKKKKSNYQTNPDHMDKDRGFDRNPDFSIQRREVKNDSDIQKKCMCVACSQPITTLTPTGSLVRWRLENIAHHSTIEVVFPNLKKGPEGFICQNCRTAIIERQQKDMDSVKVSRYCSNVKRPPVPGDTNCVCCSARFRRNYKGFVRWYLVKMAKPAIIKKAYPDLDSLEGYACGSCRSLLTRAEQLDRKRQLLSGIFEPKSEANNADLTIVKPDPAKHEFTISLDQLDKKSIIPADETKLVGSSGHKLKLKPKVSRPNILCKICDKILNGEKMFHLKRVASLDRLIQVFSQLSNRNGHLCVDCYRLYKKKIKLIPTDHIMSLRHVGYEDDAPSRAVLVGMEHCYSVSADEESAKSVPLDMEVDVKQSETQQPDYSLLDMSELMQNPDSEQGGSWGERTEDEQGQTGVEIITDTMNNFLGELSDETMIPEFAKEQQTELLGTSDGNVNNIVFIPGRVGESPGVMYQISSGDVLSAQGEVDVSEQTMSHDDSASPVAEIIYTVETPEPVTQLEVETDQRARRPGVRAQLLESPDAEYDGERFASDGTEKKNTGKTCAEATGVKKRRRGPNLSLSELDYATQKMRNHIKQDDIANMFHWLYTMENGRFKKGFLSAVRTIVKNELKGKKKMPKSLTGQLEPEAVAGFEWKKVADEASSLAPMLSTALGAVFPPEEVKSSRFSQLENVYEARKGLILSILYNSVSPRCNLPQNIIGLQLWKDGASRKVFNMLDILGVGPNEAKHSDNNKTYQNLNDSAKKTFDAWKAKAEISAVTYTEQSDSTREPVYSLIWRDVRFGASEPVDNLPPMTCLYAIRHRVPPTMLKSLTLPAVKLSPDVFIPTNENWFRYRSRMIQIVQRILIKHLKMYSEMNSDLHVAKHRCSGDMDKKSDIISLGVVLQDTSTAQGRLAVADALQSYCIQVKGHSLPVLCGGDDQTVQVIRDAQRQRSHEDSVIRRLQGLMPIPQETAKEKILLQDTFSELYDPASSNVRGTLRNIEATLKMNTMGDIMGNLQGARDLLQVSTEAFVALLAMKKVDMGNRDDYPDAQFDKDDPYFVMNHLKRVAVHIVEECWEQPPQEELQRVRNLMQSDENKYAYPYCYCRKDKEGDKIRCSYRDCPHQWLHYECLNGTPDQVGNWYCCARCRDGASKPGAFIYCWCKLDDGQAMIQCERQENCCRYQWYHTTCEGLDPQNPPDMWYCCEQCSLNLGQDDGMLQYYRHLLWRGLCHLVDQDAVHAGDGPAMLRNWKMNMIRFWKKGLLDMMRSGHMLLACVGGFASPQVTHELTWERVANLYGEDAHNVGLDTVSDILNREFKDIVRHKERMKAAKHLDISAKMVGDITIQTERILNLKSDVGGYTDSKAPGVCNTTAYHETDQGIIDNKVRVIIDEYSSDRLFTFSPPGTQSNCPSFNCNVRDPETLALQLQDMSRDLDLLTERTTASSPRQSNTEMQEMNLS